MNIAILFLIGINGAEKVRVSSNFGKIAVLFSQCLKDTLTFIIFYQVQITLFSVLFIVAGNKLSEKEYDNLNEFWASDIYTYRNSVGDLQLPDASFWIDREEAAPLVSGSMAVLLWFLWFLNNLLLCILMLNFLIAIISQSFERMMEQQLVTNYGHRIEFNRDCRIVLNYFGLLPTLNCAVISGKTLESEVDQWCGLVRSMKTYVKEQNADLHSRMKAMEAKLEKIDAKLDKLVKN